MSTVASIITKARNILADTSTTPRWSDTILLQFYNECMTQFLIDTEELETSVLVKLVDGMSTYTVSDFALVITRVEYQHNNVPFQSHRELDRLHPGWKGESGVTPNAIVYDKGNRGEFIVYPTPGDGTTTISSNSPFGIVTSISNVDSATMTYVTDYGLITDGTEELYIQVYYVAKPVDATATTDLSPIDSMWDNAFAHFIAGMALRTSQDTQSRTMASDELNLYSGLVGKAEVLTNNNNNVTRKRSSRYNGGFN